MSLTRSPLRRRSPLRTRKRIRPVNPERHARLYLRQYGGAHADRIRSLDCAGCGRPAPSQAAHVIPRGMGGVRGAWWHLVPLGFWCECHRAYDAREGRFADPELRAVLEMLAHKLAWESHDYGHAPHEPPVPRPRKE